MLKIVKIPNSVLTSTVKPVHEFDSQLETLVREMEDTLKAQVNPQGVGLAAPQIGQSQALFIIRPGKKAKIEVFVNPRILEYKKLDGGNLKLDVEVGRSKLEKNQSKKKKPHSAKASRGKRVKLEGCLSIPKIWGPVRRAEKVLLEYQDVTGKSKKKWFSGFKSVIIQHEMDHLEGILFTQRTLEQKKQLYEERDGNLEKLEY